MEHCTILAERSAPVIPSLASLLRSRGLPCMVLSGSPETEAPEGDTLRWNAPSLLSAHTAVLEAQTRFGGLASAVLAFDAESYGRAAGQAVAPNGASPADIASGIDAHVTGWIYLAESLRERFEKQKGGFLCFVHCVPPSKGDSAHRPALPLAVAVAESAFVRLAEEYSAREGVQTLMVRYENGGDEAQLEWLASRLLEGPPARGQNRWVKAGSRGLFGLL